MKNAEKQLLIEEITARLYALLEQQSPVTNDSEVETSTSSSNLKLDALRDDGWSEAAIELLERYLEHSTNYRKFAIRSGRLVFNGLATAEALDSMLAATAEGKSAVVGGAPKVAQEYQRLGEEISSATRILVGLVSSYLMDSNDFEQTGTVGPIDCSPFTRGQIYRPRLKSKEIQRAEDLPQTRITSTLSDGYAHACPSVM
jgi:hypothetical protein